MALIGSCYGGGRVGGNRAVKRENVFAQANQAYVMRVECNLHSMMRASQYHITNTEVNDHHILSIK